MRSFSRRRGVGGEGGGGGRVYRMLVAPRRGQFPRLARAGFVAAQRLAVAAKMADSHQLPSEILRQTVTNSLETPQKCCLKLEQYLFG